MFFTRQFRTLALGTLLWLASPAQAQLTPDWGAIRFGGIAGLNRSTFGGSDAIGDPRSQTGFMGGLTLMKPVGGGVALRAEVLTTRKGAVWTTQVFGASTRVGYELTYFDVPLMLAYDAPVVSGLRPHVYVGPSFNLQTGCRTRVSTQNQNSFRNCDQNIVQARSVELSGVAGGGVAFRVRRDMLGLLGARYTHGATKVFDDANVTNRMWTFYLGVEMLQLK
jgi:hypothetical protein